MSEQNEPNWGPMCEFHDLREDVAELQAALRKLVEVAKSKPSTFLYYAAIAEAERLLGDQE